jgi:hypothetical protein
MRTIPIILLLFGLYACGERVIETIEEVPFEYAYTPLTVGKFIIYEVDSVTYDLSNTVGFADTNSYEVREQIVDTTIDNAGRTVFVVHHATRKAAGEAWKLEKIYTAVLTENSYERTEDNLPFTKLIYPLKVGATFDGNRLFNDDRFIITINGETLELFKNWNAEIISIGTPATVAGRNFEEVVTVRYADDENLIERRFYEAKYAKNVGLIEKNLLVLDTQCGGNLTACDGLTWEEKAEKGFILRMRVKDFN